MKKLVVCLMLFALSFHFSGCMTTPEGVRTFTPQGKLYGRLGASLAVAAFAAKEPEHLPRLADIAGQIRLQAADGAFSSVDAVFAAVREKIDWEKLHPADRPLIEDLLAALEAELRQRIPQVELASAHLLTVAEVAGWIEDSARARLEIPPA